jgi:hypothetical protein
MVSLALSSVAGTPFRRHVMVWFVVFIAASAVLAGAAQYTSSQASIPRLQHRPGTPDESLGRATLIYPGPRVDSPAGTIIGMRRVH